MTFFIIGIFAFLATTVLAPIQLLGWWAGWYGNTNITDELADFMHHKKKRTLDKGKTFIIYLSGIGIASLETFPRAEKDFVDALRAKLPHTILISDIFPYSVTQHDLIHKHRLSFFWRWVDKLKMERQPSSLTALINIGFFINLRNIVQMALSADPRYRPIYHLGIAKGILHKLREHGFHFGGNDKLIIIGLSGGGQIALGVSGYLKKVLRTQVEMISVGGILPNDPALQYIDHVYDIYGTKDTFHKLSYFFFPSKLRFFHNSLWNQARDAGKISFYVMKGVHHTGKRDYVDKHTYLPSTIRIVTSLINAQG